MGNENSSLIDEQTPPTKLSDRSLSAVAKYIKDGKGKEIVVMTGAGLSTAAGIPDFRSPNTGLYANLARLNLPYAEAVFDIDFFRGNPDPFYVLAKELYPGNYCPTISHVFISLLAKKGLLRMLFTQNIDCLEREAGVPGDRIVEAHGSFATQRCIDCKKEFPDDVMKEHVFQGIVPRCADKKCGGLVKPDIVFFGEQLPPAFFNNRHVPAGADLVLILGTSLSVQPFASLPDMTSEDTPRVLFNMERVGTLGTRPDDVLALGDCDSNVRELADELGWRDELEALWRQVVGDKEAERQLRSVQERQAELQDEVGDLAERVGAGLHLDDDAGSATGPDGAKESGNDDKSTQASSEDAKKPSLASAGDIHDKACLGKEESRDATSDAELKTGGETASGASQGEKATKPETKFVEPSAVKPAADTDLEKDADKSVEAGRDDAGKSTLDTASKSAL